MKKAIHFLITSLPIFLVSCSASALPFEVLDVYTDTTKEGYYRVRTVLKPTRPISCSTTLLFIMEISDSQGSLGQFVAVAYPSFEDAKLLNTLGVLENRPPRPPKELAILKYECTP